MPTIALETRIDADRRRVFDLARSVEHHTETTGHDERAIAGTTSGLLEVGDTVTWRDRHFGVPMELTVEIAAMDAPTYFRDRQLVGPFDDLVHDHRFEASDDGRTVMRDEFTFSSPAGPLGTIVDRLVLERYLRNLLEERNRGIRAIAERNPEAAVRSHDGSSD